MPLFRCLNEACSDAGVGEAPVFDYAGESDACPKCGGTRKTHPQTICERARIHYLVNDPNGKIRTPRGRRAVACEPARDRLPQHATGERLAVTCPECLGSDIYRSHVEGNVEQGQQISPNIPPQMAGGMSRMG